MSIRLYLAGIVEKQKSIWFFELVLCVSCIFPVCSEGIVLKGKVQKSLWKLNSYQISHLNFCLAAPCSQISVVQLCTQFRVPTLSVYAENRGWPFLPMQDSLLELQICIWRTALTLHTGVHFVEQSRWYSEICPQILTRVLKHLKKKRRKTTFWYWKSTAVSNSRVEKPEVGGGEKAEN